MKNDGSDLKKGARKSEKRKKLFNPHIAIEVWATVDFTSCSQGAARVGIWSWLRGPSSWRLCRFDGGGIAVVGRWWIAYPLDQGFGYDIIGKGLNHYWEYWVLETTRDRAGRRGKTAKGRSEARVIGTFVLLFIHSKLHTEKYETDMAKHIHTILFDRAAQLENSSITTYFLFELIGSLPVLPAIFSRRGETRTPWKWKATQNRFSTRFRTRSFTAKKIACDWAVRARWRFRRVRCWICWSSRWRTRERRRRGRRRERRSRKWRRWMMILICLVIVVFVTNVWFENGNGKMMSEWMMDNWWVNEWLDLKWNSQLIDSLLIAIIITFIAFQVCYFYFSILSSP